MQEIYDAHLTLRCQISIIRDISNKLTPRQVVLFRDTCFGAWLDIMCSENDPGYIHYILQRRCPRPRVANLIEETEELWFRVTPDYAIRFGRREFCLVTGFRFGPKTQMTDYISGDVCNKTPGFRDRVFPQFGKSICIQHVEALFFNKETFVGSQALSDEDCVRLCIIMLVERGFMGRQPRQPIDDTLLHLLEDFSALNEYPWGSRIWELTYSQLETGLETRIVRSGMKYTMIGFIWAFKVTYVIYCIVYHISYYIFYANLLFLRFFLLLKVWIWEAYYRQVYDYARRVNTTGVPRSLYWRRLRKVLVWSEYLSMMRIPVS